MYVSEENKKIKGVFPLHFVVVTVLGSEVYPCSGDCQSMQQMFPPH